jgi:hypothetical protein
MKKLAAMKERKPIIGETPYQLGHGRSAASAGQGNFCWIRFL